MMLPDCNSYLALIIRNEISEHHPRLVVEKRPDPTNPRKQQRWVLNVSPQGMDDLNEKNQETHTISYWVSSSLEFAEKRFQALDSPQWPLRFVFSVFPFRRNSSPYC